MKRLLEGLIGDDQAEARRRLYWAEVSYSERKPYRQAVTDNMAHLTAYMDWLMTAPAQEETQAIDLIAKWEGKELEWLKYLYGGRGAPVATNPGQLLLPYSGAPTFAPLFPTIG